jgi:serine/threonine protein kinase
MVALSELIREYLSPEESASLVDAYDERIEPNLTHNELNVLVNEFYTTHLCPMLTTMFLVKGLDIVVVGSGTTGFVVRFTTPDPTAGFAQLTQNPRMERIIACNPSLTVPNTLAVKVQMFHTYSPYYEARSLRENKIMNRFNTASELIRRCTPRFYYGCTMFVPDHRLRLRFRMTFMDYINETYAPLFKRITERRAPVPTCVYKRIEQIVHALWRYGVTHNDVLLNNILVRSLDCEDPDNIRIVDFGLSRLLQPNLEGVPYEDLERRYEEYFANEDRSEQHGSNVQKLHDLLRHFQSPITQNGI